MSNLIKAYKVLGLEPGSSVEQIEQRYKEKSLAFHPSRFAGSDDKAQAERDLKNLDRARTLLLEHFRSDKHRPKNCECSPSELTRQEATRQLAPVSMPSSQPTPAPAAEPAESGEEGPSDEQMKKWDKLEKQFKREEKEQLIKKSIHNFFHQKIGPEVKPPEKRPRRVIRTGRMTIQDALDAEKGEARFADPLEERMVQISANLVDEWKAIILSPITFFQNLPTDEGVFRALRFIAVIALLNGCFWFASNCILTGFNNPKQSAILAVAGMGLIFVYTFVLSITTLALSRWFGGKGTFEGTYRACAYTFAPNVFLWLPVINFFAIIYSLILLKVALEHVQSMHSSRCTSVVGLQVLVVFLIGLSAMSKDMWDMATGNYSAPKRPPQIEDKALP